MIKKMLTILLVSSSLVSGSHAMIQEDNPHKNISPHLSIQMDIPSERNEVNSKINKTELVNTLVGLEEGTLEEMIHTSSISKWKKAQGYAARCGAISGCTLVGGAIGYGIMSGEFDATLAWSVLTLAKPIIYGSMVGYGLGWIGGNVAKAKITGRL